MNEKSFILRTYSYRVMFRIKARKNKISQCFSKKKWKCPGAMLIKTFGAFNQYQSSATNLHLGPVGLKD